MGGFSDVKLRWLIYTVAFGMVPILMRLLVGCFVPDDSGLVWLSASDFISFGIVLQVSIFNEMRYHDAKDLEWKHRMLGVSAFLMVFYAALYVILLFSEVYTDLDVDALRYSSMASSCISLLLCFVFYDRMSIAPDSKGEGL